MPQDSRPQSKDRMVRQVTSCSQIKYHMPVGAANSIKTIDAQEANGKQNEIDRLKVQLIEMQQEQNILNEQFQIQIRSLNQRINNNESTVQKLFDSGIMSMGNDQKYQELFNQIECRIADFQILVGNVEARVSQSLVQCME